MSSSCVTVNPQMVWVVFSDETDLPYLRFLKRGFRHCYVLLSDGHKWFSIDPLAHKTEIAFHDFASPFNLPLWLKSQGYIVQKVTLKTPNFKPAPMMVMTCVESVKRMIGIQCRWLITPWQLYRYLQKQEQK